MFTKLAREIAVAARAGGGDPEDNVRLRLAIQRGRESNMPMEIIDRAIKRATGGSELAALEEITYEGYGPEGIALLIEAMTDNRKRTVAEIRAAFTRAGCSLGESGSVAWLFELRGVVTIDTSGSNVDELSLIAIDAGADDIRQENGLLDVYTSPSDVERLRSALEMQSVKVTSAEASMIPKNTVELDAQGAEKTLRLVDKLEDLDDVQRVYTNAEFPDSVLEAYGD